MGKMADDEQLRADLQRFAGFTDEPTHEEAGVGARPLEEKVPGPLSAHVQPMAGPSELHASRFSHCRKCSTPLSRSDLSCPSCGANGIPRAMWIPILYAAIYVFPISLILAWGLYRRSTVAWHILVALLGVLLFIVVVLPAALSPGDAVITSMAVLFFLASVSYIAVMLRSTNQGLWAIGSWMYLLLSLSYGLALLIGRPNEVTLLRALPVTLTPSLLVVGIVFAYAPTSRWWCRARRGWTGPPI